MMDGAPSVGGFGVHPKVSQERARVATPTIHQQGIVMPGKAHGTSACWPGRHWTCWADLAPLPQQRVQHPQVIESLALWPWISRQCNPPTKSQTPCGADFGQFGMPFALRLPLRLPYISSHSLQVSPVPAYRCRLPYMTSSCS